MTPRFLCVVVGLGLWGCVVSGESEVVTTEVVTSGNDNPGPSARWSGPVAALWADVVSSPGCFFFSGPLDLGRDDHLGVSAMLGVSPAGMELRFDDGPVFSGPISGDAATVGRSAPHDFGGTWTSRETIVLSGSGSAWVGRYHYDEIDTTGRVGTCHIDATIVLTPR